jgi:hypothetical protein
MDCIRIFVPLGYLPDPGKPLPFSLPQGEGEEEQGTKSPSLDGRGHNFFESQKLLQGRVAYAIQILSILSIFKLLKYLLRSTYEKF